MFITNFLSCIRGYHILYGQMRTVVLGKQLLYERKPELYAVHQYAMAVKNCCITVGHRPQEIAVLYEEVR